jgi:hypothetical protein
MKNTIKLFFILFATILLIPACKKDETTKPIVETELITTMQVTLTSSGNPPTTLLFRDLDGDGGNPPSITGGSLKANRVYNVDIQLYDESKNPVDTVTKEILEKKEEHQFFFIPKTITVGTVYGDFDKNGKPVGLKSVWNAGSVITSGTMDIVLVHEPNKSGTNVVNGDITNAGGEEDIRVSFPIRIEL